MKKRNPTIEVTTLETGGGCCAPTTSPAKNAVTDAPCCEQPVDGSSCCNKEDSKEVNAQKTGCC